MKSEVFFVSDFNFETGNRLDVPKSGLNLVLTFLFLFKSNYLQKINPEQSPYLTRLSHMWCILIGLLAFQPDCQPFSLSPRDIRAQELGAAI